MDGRYNQKCLKKSLIFCFVLIESKQRSYLDSIIMELRKIEGVIYIHKITKGGPYDLLLKKWT